VYKISAWESEQKRPLRKSSRRLAENKTVDVTECHVCPAASFEHGIERLDFGKGGRGSTFQVLFYVSPFTSLSRSLLYFNLGFSGFGFEELFHISIHQNGFVYLLSVRKAFSKLTCKHLLQATFPFICTATREPSHVGCSRFIKPMIPLSHSHFFLSEPRLL